MEDIEIKDERVEKEKAQNKQLGIYQDFIRTLIRKVKNVTMKDFKNFGY